MEILCSSPWVPGEWILAHGLNPRGAWAALPDPVDADFEGRCAFAQRLVNYQRTHRDTGIIFTTACDQMRRAADAVVDGPARVFLFNLPATWQTSTARRIYHDEIKRLGQFLVRLGGTAPSEERLEAVLLEWDRRRQRLREMAPQAGGRFMADTLMDFFQDGQIPGGSPGAPSRGVPLALVGGPILRSQLDLFETIESAGGRVALNALEPGERCLLPPLPCRHAGQTAFTVMADHYFDHSVDVFHRPNSRLYTWLGARLAERCVRGMVLRVQVGCDLWRAEFASLQEEFNLPVLVLDEHEARTVDPRDLTRLSAFVESLP